MKTFKRNYNWEIETESGTHVIALRLGVNSRDPIDVFLDEKKIKTLKYEGLSLIPNMEYPFQ